MGACSFENTVMNPDVRKAFNHAHDQAQYERGHGGYSGTIAEKDGYRVLSRTPMAGAELADFIDSRLEENDKWGPAFAVPLAKVTKGKTTTKTVTVRAKTESEARQLAAAKIKKSRKGDVRVGIKGIERKGSDSPHTLKVRKQRLLKQTPKVRYKSGPQRFKTLPEAMKHAEDRARRAIERGETRFNNKFDVVPMLVAVVDGKEQELGHVSSAGRVTIGRNDRTVAWEVTAEVQSVKVEKTIAGWVFFGYASE